MIKHKNIMNLSLLKKSSFKDEKTINKSEEGNRQSSLNNLYNLYPYEVFNNYNDVDMSFLDKYISEENIQEDKRITAEYFKLVTIDELISCVILIMTISSCFIYNETKTCLDDCLYDNSVKEDIINLSLIFSSISTFIFILLLIIKYNHYFKFYKKAKYIHNYESFFKTKLIGSFIIEFTLAILHPNLLFKDKYFTTNKDYNLKEVTYCINDIFLLIQSFRLLYLIMIFVVCSEFYSPRADRVCKLMGKRLNLIFSFKALLIKKTAPMLIYCTFVIGIILSYNLKILSQPLPNTSISYNFNNFGNCFWYVLVTMTTVGYGDIYPETTLGRIVGCTIAISGNILVALIISFFQEQTYLLEEEKKALDFIQRVNDKEEIMEASAEYFKSNMMYIINRKKMEKKINPPNEKNKNYLIKLAKEKIEARKRFKFLFHQFQNHFKMETEFDIIRKKIDNLDFAEEDLANLINTINIKIKELIRNINGLSNNLKKNNKNVNKNNIHINTNKEIKEEKNKEDETFTKELYSFKTNDEELDIANEKKITIKKEK